MAYRHLTNPFPYANFHFMGLVEKASQKIAERLSWCTAHRDQAGIAKDLADGKDISEVYGLGEAGLFDEFFYFLDQFGIMDLFNKLDPKITTRESNVKFPAVILIYLMRIVAGLAFFLAYTSRHTQISTAHAACGLQWQRNKRWHLQQR